MPARKKSKARKRRSPIAAPSFDSKEMRDFEAKNDLDTLRRADEIKGNTSRMSRAKKMAKREMDALKKV